MENKEELIAQLRKARDLLHNQDSAERELEKLRREIVQLLQKNKTGVPYQNWHSTGHAESTRKMIEEELHSQKVRMRTPCIITLAVSGALCFSIGWYSDVVAVIMLALAIASLILLIKVQKGESAWSADQYVRLDWAKKKDAENKALNDQKKAELDAQLRQKNNMRIEALTEQSKDKEDTLRKIRMGLREITVLGDGDKVSLTVCALLNILESNRANTMQEALRIYDEQQHREKMQEEQRRATRIQARMLEQIEENEAHRQEEAERLLQELRRREREEAEHRQRMEQLAQQQVNEMERKRKADDDYRRSGYIREG